MAKKKPAPKAAPAPKGDHEGLCAYPDDLPTQTALKIIAEALRGNVPDPKEAAHAAWHAVGYGLSVWDAHPAAKPEMMGAQTPMSAAAAAECLDACCDPSKGMHAAAIPWAALLPILLQLLQALLTKKAEAAPAGETPDDTTTGAAGD
jgi:hypothetical protein